MKAFSLLADLIYKAGVSPLPDISSEASLIADANDRMLVFEVRTLYPPEEWKKADPRLHYLEEKERARVAERFRNLAEEAVYSLQIPDPERVADVFHEALTMERLFLATKRWEEAASAVNKYAGGVE
jgi:hypothetical protein